MKNIRVVGAHKENVKKDIRFAIVVKKTKSLIFGTSSGTEERKRVLRIV